MKISQKATPVNRPTVFITVMMFMIGLVMVVQSCKKTSYPDNRLDPEISDRRRNNPPPPPPPFYFDNCSHPSITGNFVAGVNTTSTITLNYVNSPGGPYPAFTSATVNGVTLKTAAGTLKKGTGTITFNASGKPVNAGFIIIPVSIGGSYACNLSIAVLNSPPVAGNCSDPGPAPGSTGCITFSYRGQQVTYATVRAADGKIWLKQNVGSPHVALSSTDQASFGHYFQWGRWDDGHQMPGSPSIAGSSSLQNPSHIASGNPNFIKGTSATTSWWGVGGAITNTWLGITPSTTNGKDPCLSLGSGWHLPSAAEWNNLINTEIIFDAQSAFDSRLKLTQSGYRNSVDGSVIPNFVGGYYWSSTAANGNTANNFFFDDVYNALTVQTGRGYGFNCRCAKN